MLQITYVNLQSFMQTYIRVPIHKIQLWAANYYASLFKELA